MKKTNVEIDENPVDFVDSYKYLGCIIDDKLTFRDHVDQQIKKVYVFHFPSNHVLLTMHRYI